MDQIWSRVSPFVRLMLTVCHFTTTRRAASVACHPPTCPAPQGLVPTVNSSPRIAYQVLVYHFVFINLFYHKRNSYNPAKGRNTQSKSIMYKTGRINKSTHCFLSYVKLNIWLIARHFLNVAAKISEIIDHKAIRQNKKKYSFVCSIQILQLFWQILRYPENIRKLLPF